MVACRSVLPQDPRLKVRGLSSWEPTNGGPPSTIWSTPRLCTSFAALMVADPAGRSMVEAAQKVSDCGRWVVSVR